MNASGKTPELVPGTRIVCPKCGKEGTVKVETFKAKGKEYKYWVVVHSHKRCVIGRYVPEAKAPLESLESLLERFKSADKRFYVRPEGPEELQRAIWHVYKVAASWGSLRENPTPENLDMFNKALERVKQLDGDLVRDIVDALQQLAYHYVSQSGEAARSRIRGHVNELLRNLLTRVALSKAPQQVPQQRLEAGPAGPEIRAKVTKNDSKRGKVYVPVDWVGKTVAVRLVPEGQNGN